MGFFLLLQRYQTHISLSHFSAKWQVSKDTLQSQFRALLRTWWPQIQESKKTVTDDYKKLCQFRDSPAIGNPHEHWLISNSNLPFSFCLIHCTIIFQKPWLRVWINIEIFNIMKYSRYWERIQTMYLYLERKWVLELHRANGLLTKVSILHVTWTGPHIFWVMTALLVSKTVCSLTWLINQYRIM